MKAFKKPEYFLLLTSVLYWYFTANLLNPVGIGLVVLLSLQLFIQKRFLGLLLGSVLSLASFYMMLALVSELLEFTEVNGSAIMLGAIGGISLMANLLFSILLTIKNIETPERPQLKPLESDR